MKDTIVELLSSKNYSKIKTILVEVNPADLAMLFEEFDVKDVPLLFRLIPKEPAAETFAYMSTDMQKLLIESFSDYELREVMDELFLDDTVDIIEEMPANVVTRILKSTDKKTRITINELLNYPKDSAGSIMTTEFIYLRQDITVTEAFAKIRTEGVDKETIYTCYVTENRKLIGLVTVKDLLISEETAVIRNIMETNIISVHTHEDKEEVVKILSKYDFIAVPVVDNEQRLVGIVTFDDAIDVMEQENTEDIAKMAAVSPSDESYFKTPVYIHAKNRIFWLLVLMISSILTGAILEKYEAAFAAVPILVSFIPMLMGTGGNCGSQSSTMVIRGLALDEIKPKDFFRVIFKELRVALIVSPILAIINGIRIKITYFNEEYSTELAIVIGLSIIGEVILAKMIGCMLPMIAKKLKIDPAIMAAPLISTILDACSMLIYFNIASMIMSSYIAG